MDLEARVEAGARRRQEVMHERVAALLEEQHRREEREGFRRVRVKPPLSLAEKAGLAARSTPHGS
jgi:hypothetical protein